MKKVLEINNLTKIFEGTPDFTAVDRISFDLREGEILGFLGPNGSGKTTTIHMLLGILTHTSGSIHYFGKDFSQHRSEILQSVSFASTYTSLPWSLTIEENLIVYGMLHGLSLKESRQKFSPLLERFGILSKLHERVANLSAGQITRLMLVKAFFVEPKIALLDEPTASLDPEISKEICQFLLEQREKKGLSILFTSHKMDEASEICDRVIFLKRGKIIANGLPKQLAKAITGHKLKLTLTEGLDAVLSLVQEKNFPHKMEATSIEITLVEEEIPSFLSAIAKPGISYTQVNIQEPSLEDYFLSVAKDLHEL